MSDQYKCPECFSVSSRGSIDTVDEVVCDKCGVVFSLNDKCVTNSEMGSSLNSKVVKAIDRIDELFDALGDGSSDNQSNIQVPDRIGDYVILKQIGVGAFSSVYLAHDTTLDRSVAIKIPRRQTLSKTQQKRLLREARMAAQLNHPGIVTVHEVIEHDETLYIVSDFVEGETLDRWLRQRSRSLVDKMSVFRSLCDAVAYAHQNKIVHRDLKPSNVIVDDQGNPYVLDFGLARQLDEDSSLTVEGRIVGTPAYMSPEQAEGQKGSVNQSSDVYSLGVIMFELLTGERPFKGNTERIVYQLIHEIPTSPSRLDASIPKPLETICLKSIHKEASRRYPSANEIAEDLMLWTNNHPINAQPIRTLERLLLWRRRNPLIATLSLCTVTLLVVGIVISSLLSIWALEERDSANQAKAQTLLALEQTETARIEAEQNFQEARKTVDEFYRIVSRTALLDQPGATQLRQHLLVRARDFYEKYLRNRSDDTALAMELATARLELASVLELLEETSSALSEYRRVIESLDPVIEDGTANYTQLAQYLISHGNVAKLSFLIGDEKSAKENYEIALSVYEQLESVESMRIESDSIADHRITVASILNNYGEYQISVGELQASLETYHRATRYCEEVVSSGTPELLLIQHSLAKIGVAYVYTELGKIDSAISELQRVRESLAHEIEDSDFNVELFNTFVVACNDLSYCLSRKGDSAHSMNILVELSKSTEDVAAAFPGILVFKNELSTQYNNLGAYHHEAGNLSEAIRYLTKAIEIRAELSEEFPQLTDYMRDLANSHNNLAMCFFAAGRMEDAVIHMDKSVSSFEALSNHAPENTEFKKLLGVAHSNVAHRLSQLNRFDEAKVHAQKAVLIFKRLVDAVPEVADHRLNLAWSLANQARSLVESDLARAIQISAKSVELYKTIENEQSGVVEFKMLMSSSLIDAGRMNARVGNHDAAIGHFTEAIDKLTQLVRQFPENENNQERLVDAHIDRLKSIEESSASPSELLEFRFVFDSAMASFLEKFSPRISQAKAHALNLKRIAALKARNEEYKGANEYLRRAMKFYEKLLNLENVELINQRDYAVCFTEYGLNLISLGDLDAALVSFEEGYALLKQLEVENPMFVPLLADRMQVCIAMANASFSNAEHQDAKSRFQEVIDSSKELFDEPPSIPTRFAQEITSYTVMSYRGLARVFLDEAQYERAVQSCRDVILLSDLDGYELSQLDLVKTTDLLDEIYETVENDDTLAADKSDELLKLLMELLNEINTIIVKMKM